MNLSAMPMVPAIGPTNDITGIAQQGKAKDPKAIDNVATGFEVDVLVHAVQRYRANRSLSSDSMFQGDKSDVLGGLFDYFHGGQHTAPFRLAGHRGHGQETVLTGPSHS